MSHISREKIALVVFGALIVVSLCGLIGYLALGHSWNVAASNIDDATGRMDGYTAIVFKGTVDPALAEEKADATSTSKNADAASKSKDTESTLPQQGKESDAKKSGSSTTPVTTDAETDADTRTPEKGTSGADAIDAKDALDAADVGDATDAADTQSGKQNGGALSELDAEPSTVIPKKKVPVDLIDVEESYLEKNATVFTLDTTHIATYSEGTILRKGDHRFGVFSVSTRTTARSIAQLVEYFREHEVDFIVALTPDKKLVEDAEGLDIVISTQDEGLFVMGETINGTFYVNAPALGSAGVILISPSNVVSAKVIQPE